MLLSKEVRNMKGYYHLIGCPCCDMLHEPTEIETDNEGNFRCARCGYMFNDNDAKIYALERV